MPGSERKFFSMCCVAKEEKKILSVVEKIIVCKSCAFEAMCVETRKDSNVEGRDGETYAVVCAGMGIASLLGERCCVKYCP